MPNDTHYVTNSLSIAPPIIKRHYRLQTQWVNGSARVFSMPFDNGSTMWQLSFPCTLGESIRRIAFTYSIQYITIHSYPYSTHSYPYSTHSYPYSSHSYPYSIHTNCLCLYTMWQLSFPCTLGDQQITLLSPIQYIHTPIQYIPFVCVR